MDVLSAAPPSGMTMLPGNTSYTAQPYFRWFCCNLCAISQRDGFLKQSAPTHQAEPWAISYCRPELPRCLMVACVSIFASTVPSVARKCPQKPSKHTCDRNTHLSGKPKTTPLHCARTSLSESVTPVHFASPASRTPDIRNTQSCILLSFSWSSWAFRTLLPTAPRRPVLGICTSMVPLLRMVHLARCSTQAQARQSIPSAMDNPYPEVAAIWSSFAGGQGQDSSTAYRAPNMNPARRPPWQHRKVPGAPLKRGRPASNLPDGPMARGGDLGRASAVVRQPPAHPHPGPSSHQAGGRVGQDPLRDGLCASPVPFRGSRLPSHGQCHSDLESHETNQAPILEHVTALHPLPGTLGGVEGP